MKDIPVFTANNKNAKHKMNISPKETGQLSFKAGCNASTYGMFNNITMNPSGNVMAFKHVTK